MAEAASRADDPDHQTAGVDLADLVPRAAERWPDDIALVGDVDRLTWARVERRTRHLAATLISCGVAPGDRVAVSRLKSNESFEAVHAILRAGAAVVPIDPLVPPAAVRDVLADADVTAVIGDAALIAPVEPWSVLPDLRCVIGSGTTGADRMLPWEGAVNGEVASDSIDLPVVAPDDVAYLIYTSGSTGRPKGIVHTHRSGHAYAVAAASEHGLRRDDRLAGMAPLHFDMSTLELFAAPLVGACVVTMSELLVRFPASFTERCERERVTVWYSVPTIFQEIVERGGLERRDLSAVRWIGYGGEPYPVPALRRLMDAFPGVEIVNVYGPAEVNACTTYVVDELAPDATEVPIGRPWPAAEVRVVDEAGGDVPSGDVGELQVSARTAMSGYWRQPALTDARFRPRPDGPPWYATGDLVERDEDGLLWFRGRLDHQVKVRGVRIELEAVEAVVAAAPGVAKAVAGLVGATCERAHIAAAVVPDDDADVDPEAVRSWCVERLPPVAVPLTIQIRTNFPATQSGKIDRRLVRAELAADAMHIVEE